MTSDTTTLTAGAAQTDITPWAGVHLSGDIGRYRPAKLILDPLFARALVLRSGERVMAIIALDLCIITKANCQQIRTLATERFGIEPDALMIHATQTHTAPGLGHFMLDDDFPGIPEEYAWLRGGDPAYDDFVIAQSIEALAKAVDALQPVQVGVGSGIEGRYASNRRAIMRDGSIGMPWKGWQGGKLGPVDILYMEGPMDPEVGVCCLRGEDLRPLAVLLNYACHPVHVFPKVLVSADWPGAWATELQARFGGTPIVLNGCCGNLNPWPPFDPDYREDHRVMGHALTEMAGNVLEEITYAPAEIDWRTRRIRIPFRDFPADEVTRAQAVIDAADGIPFTDDAHTAVPIEWMYAASYLSACLQARREGVFAYEIQAMRIGDAAFVGLPGEPFIEGALWIKEASPTRWTYVVHMVNQYVGYIPIKEAIARGGHECATRYWAKLAPDALETIAAEATALLHDLFATSKVSG
jgi:neutral ceramidase